MAILRRELSEKFGTVTAEKLTDTVVQAVSSGAPRWGGGGGGGGGGGDGERGGRGDGGGLGRGEGMFKSG